MQHILGPLQSHCWYQKTSSALPRQPVDSYTASDSPSTGLNWSKVIKSSRRWVEAPGSPQSDCCVRWLDASLTPPPPPALPQRLMGSLSEDKILQETWIITKYEKTKTNRIWGGRSGFVNPVAAPPTYSWINIKVWHLGRCLGLNKEAKKKKRRHCSRKNRTTAAASVQRK